jgi:hypothetical protein
MRMREPSGILFSYTHGVSRSPVDIRIVQEFLGHHDVTAGRREAERNGDVARGYYAFLVAAKPVSRRLYSRDPLV